ncbi:hypothetical protein MMC13_001847 [Lambiella insularis]|nr:hypothetical protein [Lambiella insularis]
MLIVFIVLGLLIVLSVIACCIRASRTRYTKQLSPYTASPHVEPGPMRNDGWRNPNVESRGRRFGGGEVLLKPYISEVGVDVPPPAYGPER